MKLRKIHPGGVVNIMVLFPPATEAIGAMGREIESRQVRTVVVFLRKKILEKLAPGRDEEKNLLI
jgi:hypothetical protein